MPGDALPPVPWDLDLAGRDWRLEASIGINRGEPFAGLRLMRYDNMRTLQKSIFQVWEESLFVIPSAPPTALIAIGNVTSGAINHMREELARLNAEEHARVWGGRHRRT